MKKKLRIAILGCGRIGKRHAEHAAIQGLIVAVCDINKESADFLGSRNKSKVFYSLKSLIEAQLNIDIIAICTPNGLHAEHSIMALEAGYNVLCEKPMSLSTEDAGKMIKTAERANRRLFIVKQNRFNPPVEALKKLLDENRLGKIFSIQLNCFWNRNSDYYVSSDWKGTNVLDGGTLFTQFSHFIDLLLYFFGDVSELNGFVDNFNHKEEIEFEDTGVIVLKFKSGILGSINYTVNSFGKNMEGSLTVFGEKGTVKIGGQYLNEIDYQNISGEPLKDLPEGNLANAYGGYFGSMSNHDKVYNNVIDVMLNGGVISTSSYEGLKTVELIEKIYENLR
jgi:UDP-N-acetyl-2-amino-2-deoxyglucuronate dehydrogenase